MGKYMTKAGDAFYRIKVGEEATESVEYWGRTSLITTTFLMMEVAVRTRILLSDFWYYHDWATWRGLLNVHKHNGDISFVEKPKRICVRAANWEMLHVMKKTQKYGSRETPPEEGGITSCWEMSCVIVGGGAVWSHVSSVGSEMTNGLKRSRNACPSQNTQLDG